MIRLSFCIPVFNGAAYIGQALDSVLSQSGPDVEIVVLDGGSSDDTGGIMSRYCGEHANILYERLPQRGGIDADLATCVALAGGEYCWLLSGDDVLAPGAVSRARALLSSGADVYLCRHESCDKDMVPHGIHPVFSPDVPRAARWEDPGSRAAWLGAAATSEALFSFMSTIIVRRAFWNAGRLIPRYTGSCWAHVARMLELGQQGMHVQYVPETLVLQRGENDSFRTRGLIARYALAIDGYTRLARDFLATTPGSAGDIRRCLRREFTPSTLAMARLLPAHDPDAESQVQLDALIDALYPPRSLSALPVRGAIRWTPGWLLRAIRGAWLRLRPDTPFSRMWRDRLAIGAAR